MASKKISLGEVIALIALNIYFLWKLNAHGFVDLDEKYVRVGWAVLFLLLLIWSIFDWLKDDNIETTTGNIFKFVRRISIFILLAVGFYIKVIT